MDFETLVKSRRCLRQHSWPSFYRRIFLAMRVPLDAKRNSSSHSVVSLFAEALNAPGAGKNRCSNMPATIAPRNANTDSSSATAAARAGPGQSPASPQPMPNKVAPLISFKSMSVFSGRKNLLSKSGRSCFSIQRKAGIVTARPAAITRARLGSQFPAKSRKPMTFCGLIMPDIVRPSPKRKPDSNIQPNTAQFLVFTSSPPEYVSSRIQ